MSEQVLDHELPSYYLALMAALSALMDINPPVGTPEGDLLDGLADLTEKFENQRYPPAAPGTADAP